MSGFRVKVLDLIFNSRMHFKLCQKRYGTFSLESFENLAATSVTGFTSQRLQYPLIKEYSVNDIRDPTIIYGIFLN